MLLKENLSWEVIKQEIYATSQPICLLSKKLRVEIEYDKDLVNAEKLLIKANGWLAILQNHTSSNLLTIDFDLLESTKPLIRILIDSINDLSSEERGVVYYSLVKGDSEYNIANFRLPFSKSKVHRLKKSGYKNLLENIEYHKLTLASNNSNQDITRDLT